MRFSPRSLLAWIAVAIAGGDSLGRRGPTAMSLGAPTEKGPDGRPTERASRGR